MMNKFLFYQRRLEEMLSVFIDGRYLGVDESLPPGLCSMISEHHLAAKLYTPCKPQFPGPYRSKLM